MSNIYQDKNIFISGASRGLGFHLARLVLERDARKVYVTARDKASLSKIEAIDKERVIPVEMELSDSQSILNAVAAAEDASIVINNAGVLHFGSVLTMPMEELKEDMNVNHYGTLEVIRAFYPHLKRQSDARIVNILSVVALANKNGIGGYATTKAAAFSATQAIRGALAKAGIDVQAAFPAGMDTDMLARVTQEQKDDPADIATEILDEVAKGVSDIYVGSGKKECRLWAENPRKLQLQFTGA